VEGSLRILKERLAAAPASWVGPRLQFGLDPLVFHLVITRNPQEAAKSIRRALDEVGKLRCVTTFWRANPLAEGSVQPGMRRKLEALSRRLRDVLENTLRSGLVPREAERRRRVLADMDDPDRTTYVVGCVIVSPLSINDDAIRPLPTGVSPSGMLAHPGVWTAILSGDRGSIGAGLIQKVAEGRVVLYPEARRDPEEAPVLAGRTPLGAPVYVHLGAWGRAQHILVAGPTGRGKSVTAMRLVRGAMRAGAMPLILDTKGEMVRGEGRGVFGLPVLDPAARDVRWPPWTLPAAHALLPRIRERMTRRPDGRAVLRKEDIRAALERANPDILTSVTLLSQLLRFISGGEIDLNPSEFAARYVRRLLESAAWLSLDGPLSLAAGMAREAEVVLREAFGERGVRQIVSPEAPFRHLVVADAWGFGDLLRDEGAVVSFRTAAGLIGRRGDELLSDLYAFVLGLVISAIITARETSGQRRRVLLYVEEAHRVRDLVEAMLRLLRAFDVSVMLVTQSFAELTPASLEQIRHFLVMGPPVGMLRDLFSRLGVPYAPEPFVPAEPYGVGVYISLSSGRPAPPQVVRVDLSPDEQKDILGRGREAVEL